MIVARTFGSARYPYRYSDIREAGRRAIIYLQNRNGGKLPETFREAWRLVIRCGLSCRHLREGAALDGELVEHDPGEWTIFYSPRLSEERRVRVLIHELAEWLCITESPVLMPDLPGGGIYHYDGGDNPRDVRHRAAKHAERLYLRMLREQNRVERTINQRCDCGC